MFKPELLKAELIKQRLSSEQAAKMLGMNPATFSKKVNGHSEWTLKEIQTIAEMFGKEEMQKIFFNE